MLRAKVRTALETSGLTLQNNLVVAGVSGGPDSVALLHVLASLRPLFGFDLHLAHLNHRLRGSESDKDAQFVRDLAERFQIPFTIETADIPTIRRQRGLGIEDAARVARYQFFTQLVDRLGAICVAVGHTEDDQVETIVQHWLRGAGLAGLRGMRAVSGQNLGRSWTTHDKLLVLRPLLTVSRREIETYLRTHALSWREDRSNLDFCYQRNRVRIELLPLLEQYNPGFRNTLLRAASIASQDYNYIQSSALEAWTHVAQTEVDAIVIDLDKWSKLPDSLQFHLLRHAVTVLLGDAMDISSVHVSDAVEAMRNKPVGTTIVWPRQLRIVKGYRDFQIRVGDIPESEPIPAMQELAIPGQTRIAGTEWQVVATITDQRCIAQGKDLWHADLDYDLTGSRLWVRGRKAGDTFVPLGMKNSKKLQDYMVDTKIPKDKRDAIPIVVSPTQIVWVAGQRIDDRVKVKQKTHRILCLTFLTTKENQPVSPSLNQQV